MRKIEFIESFELSEYLDDWAIVSATEEKFDIVLTYINLLEFKHFNYAELSKLNKRIYVNLYLESPFEGNANTNSDIIGVVASKKNALTYVQIIVKVIDDLKLIFEQSETGITSTVCNGLNFFLTTRRSKNDYAAKYSKDQELINTSALSSIVRFAKVKDKLVNKEANVLRNSIVYLTIVIVE